MQLDDMIQHNDTCYTPNHIVLKKDGTWVKIKDVNPDEISSLQAFKPTKWRDYIILSAIITGGIIYGVFTYLIYCRIFIN